MRRAIIPLAVFVLTIACHRQPASGHRSEFVAIVEGTPLIHDARVWSDVRLFYQAREFQPAWIGDRRFAEAHEALAVLRTAPAHGLSEADYDEPGLTTELAALAQSKSDIPSSTWVELDVRITAALLALGRDVAMGRTAPGTIDGRWKVRRAPTDLVETLTAARHGGGVKTWLAAVQPDHPEYAALAQAMLALRDRREKGGWSKVPAGTFKAGVSGPAVVALRQRLAASGELTAAAAASGSLRYDQEVEDAVRAFQEHHAIKATGIVDSATLAELNVPIDARMRQLEINLERWRWMPDDFGARHLLVNVPAFVLIAREDGQTILDIRVVVGKPEHETPIFSGDMKQVVFSPYWNVPDSIVEGETAPAVARDPAYLARNNIEILRPSKSGMQPVDPEDVDWGNADELKQLAFRQRPGAKNALGHVKFLFPNSYNIYLHDTPADALFERPGRAFSHGCVRVEEPETLAKYVLRGYSDWDEPKILAAMNAGVEQYVKLKETIPVHIVYFTAWIDEKGGTHFYDDVYGYDAKQDRSRANPN